MSRGLLIALTIAAITGLLGVTFLVGRESARARPPAPTTAITSASPVSVPPGTPSAPSADSSAPTLSTIEPPPLSAQASAPNETAAPIPAAAPHDKLRDEVASYFREVEAIQGRAKSWGDPEAFAQKLVEQAGKGDVSGFDGLADANQKVRDGLLAVPVPEPCREHHRLTLTLLDESIAMLGRVKGQINGADLSSLAAMPAQGKDLERKAKNVDAMAADIKRRFGL